MNFCKRAFIDQAPHKVLYGFKDISFEIIIFNFHESYRLSCYLKQSWDIRLQYLLEKRRPTTNIACLCRYSCNPTNVK